MIPSRIRKKFRYQGDAQEVELKLSIEEARAIAIACRDAYDEYELAQKLGFELCEFLDVSEDSNAHVFPPLGVS